MFLSSEIPPESVQTVVVPFINKYFSANSLSDYENKYLKVDSSIHGDIAVHVEAMLISIESHQFPITDENTKFFVYKLNRGEPEMEMIEVNFLNSLSTKNQ